MLQMFRLELFRNEEWKCRKKPPGSRQFPVAGRYEHGSKACGFCIGQGISYCLAATRLSVTTLLDGVNL
jgi:hypothetical protein